MIGINFWLQAKNYSSKDVYNKVIFQKGCKQGAHKKNYLLPYFNPGGYGQRFDGLANSLALHFDVLSLEKQKLILGFVDRTFSKRTKNLDMLDLRAEKEFNIGFGRLAVILDLFNILGYSRLHIDTNNGGYLYPDGTFERYSTAGQILSLQEGARIFKFSLKFAF